MNPAARWDLSRVISAGEDRLSQHRPTRDGSEPAAYNPRTREESRRDWLLLFVALPVSVAVNHHGQTAQAEA